MSIWVLHTQISGQHLHIYTILQDFEAEMKKNEEKRHNFDLFW